MTQRSRPPFETRRERSLSAQELRRLSDALADAERTTGSPAILAIRLLLTTGCRSSEIRTLRWDEVDFEGKCLRLRRTKTGESKVVELDGTALEILAHIPRDGDHVFSGDQPGRSITDLTRPWERLCRTIGLEDVRLYDLRRIRRG